MNNQGYVNKNSSNGRKFKSLGEKNPQKVVNTHAQWMGVHVVLSTLESKLALSTEGALTATV